jgi:hypothetical protein
MTQYHQTQKNHSRSSQRVIKFVYYIIIGILFSVCLWSSIPYIELVHKGFDSVSVPAYISKPINFIPVVGAVFDSILRFAWVIIGLLLWSFVTLCELAPCYIKKDKAMLKLLITESQGANTIPVVEGEDALLTTLKKLYNHIPAQLLKRAHQIAVVAYICDLLIVVQKYPICQGGVSKFNYLLSTGQWDKFDLGNVTLLLLNLFLVEAIVRFLFHFFEMRYYVRRAHG